MLTLKKQQARDRKQLLKRRLAASKSQPVLRIMRGTGNLREKKQTSLYEELERRRGAKGSALGLGRRGKGSALGLGSACAKIDKTLSAREFALKLRELLAEEGEAPGEGRGRELWRPATAGNWP